MTELRDKHPLPDVDTVPLIMDVEFTETEEDIDIPILDSFVFVGQFLTLA